MTNSSPEIAPEHAPQDRILRAGTVAAVVLAAIGLTSLVAVLISAAVGVQVWPGLLLLAYTCLPVAFIVLAAMVVVGLVRRRRH
ncbi:hypothetical protein [Arthrobacter roseus]|uniref:hypothetical protein n=1 Tax=Arthrobacter roseus TaxID=136274 RepID=UPI001965B52E|nr:hypothetical protein [Arthrobacter roseus]MBM7847749.1 hypothetical protein [Arthrobacter roseus]